MCALEYDGIDTYLGCGDDSIFSFGDGVSDIPFSVMAWTYMNDATDFCIAGKNQRTTVAEWEFRTRLDKLVFFVSKSNGGAFLRIQSSSNITAYEGMWIHVAVTYDGSGNTSGLTLYLSGEVLPSTFYEYGTYVAMSNTASPVEIGITKRGSAVDWWADGKIAEVSIWRNRELTQVEIQSFMTKKLIGGETGLVGYWPINDAGVGTSVPIKDIAGGYNGVMNAFGGNPWRGGPPIVLGRAH